MTAPNTYPIKAPHKLHPPSFPALTEQEIAWIPDWEITTSYEFGSKWCCGWAFLRRNREFQRDCKTYAVAKSGGKDPDLYSKWGLSAFKPFWEEWSTADSPAIEQPGPRARNANTSFDGRQRQLGKLSKYLRVADALTLMPETPRKAIGEKFHAENLILSDYKMARDEQAIRLRMEQLGVVDGESEIQLWINQHRELQRMLDLKYGREVHSIIARASDLIYRQGYRQYFRPEPVEDSATPRKTRKASANPWTEETFPPDLFDRNIKVWLIQRKITFRPDRDGW